MRMTIKNNKEQHLNKTFLVIRPGNFAQYLKPMRATKPNTCAISGENIEVGDYVYPCLSNPIRLSPTGRERCHIGYTLKQGDKILPQGYMIIPIPTYEMLKVRGYPADNLRNETLKKIANKLLIPNTKGANI